MKRPLLHPKKKHPAQSRDQTKHHHVPLKTVGEKGYRAKYHLKSKHKNVYCTYLVINANRPSDLFCYNKNSNFT